MICDHERSAVVRLPATAEFSHHRSRSQKAFHRYGTERDQHLRLNDLDLLKQIRPARLHFCQRWSAVSKTSGRHIWPALQDIGNVYFAAIEVHRLDNFRQQLAGASDKRFTLLVFIRSWRFTDEHQVVV